MKTTIAIIIFAFTSLVHADDNNWHSIRVLDPSFSEPGWEKSFQEKACKPVDLLKRMAELKKVAEVGKPALEYGQTDGEKDKSGKVHEVSVAIMRVIGGEPTVVIGESFYRSKQKCLSTQKTLWAFYKESNAKTAGDNSKYK